MADFQSTESLTTAPPPPMEVKVRTMRSDLESMAKSGGGLPNFQNVKVEAGIVSAPSGDAKRTNPLEIAAIVLLSLFIFAAIGYFVYRFFVK